MRPRATLVLVMWCCGRGWATRSGVGGPYSFSASGGASSSRKPSAVSAAPSVSALTPSRLARSGGGGAGARRVRKPSSAAMRSATSSRSSTGPAGSQPMVWAKPGGQPSGRRRVGLALTRLAQLQRDQARRGQRRGVDVARHRPELRPQRHGARLQRLRHEQREAAGADADRLQLLPQVLADLGIGVAGDQAEVLAQLEGRAAQRALGLGLGLDRRQDGELLAHQPFDILRQPGADPLALGAVEELARQHLDLRLAGLGADRAAGRSRPARRRGWSR